MRLLALPALAACLVAQGRPASSPADLQIRVLESSGPVHVTGSRSSSAMAVQVAGRDGSSVPGAIVHFQLPASGAGGAFFNGLTTDVVTTGADGKAVASGVQWSTTPGAFEIRVTATLGQQRVSASYPHKLLASAADSRVVVSSGRKRSKLILLVAGAAAGGVVASLAIARKRGGSTSSATSTEPVVSIGAPVITIGPY